MTIGERIKRRRNELHLSQRDLSNMMGYSNHSTIGKIETGKVDIPQSRIVQFANVLGVSIAYLMGWEEEELKTEKPPTPEEQEQEARTKEFIELFRILPPEYQVLILTQIRGLLTQLK